MPYRIEFADTATDALLAIKDRRTQQAIVRRVEALAEDPKKQGKPMRGDLAGLFSVRAAGQRYRILFGIDEELGLVRVALLGIRREGSRSDIYELAGRLLRRGLL